MRTGTEGYENSSKAAAIINPVYEARGEQAFKKLDIRDLRMRFMKFPVSRKRAEVIFATKTGARVSLAKRESPLFTQESAF